MKIHFLLFIPNTTRNELIIFSCKGRVPHPVICICTGSSLASEEHSCSALHCNLYLHWLFSCKRRVPHPVICICTGSVSCPSQKLGIILDSILSHHLHPNNHHVLSTIKPFHLCALSLPLTVLQVRPPSSLTWIAAKPPKVVLFAPIHSSGGSDGKEFTWM